MFIISGVATDNRAVIIYFLKNIID
jgi:hypothetical protein